MSEIPHKLAVLLRDEIDFAKNALATNLVEKALKYASKELPLSTNLSAVFDLVVASKYYRLVLPENWLWCEWSDLDFFPFQNACPFCVLKNRFVHHQGNKPGSGQIGPATAEAFREVLSAYFGLTNRKNIKVWSASEPIDIAIADIKARNLFIAEVKAAPLFTPPLCQPHTKISIQTSGSAPLKHSRGVARNLHLSDISIFFPTLDNSYSLLPLPKGSMEPISDIEASISSAISKEPDAIKKYFSVWRRMWAIYKDKNASDNLYWYCGACGLPRNPGEGWPKSADGKPRGSISDSKTSVGMDRTDDIKKATFQVLRLGVENRKEKLSPWELKIGLASNVHAARHYSDYLEPYEKIVWGWSDENKRPENIYNLFDGIISFTKSYARDAWLCNLVDWEIR